MPEISKAYEPQSVEDKWYQFWLDGKFFVANEHSAKPAYSIVIPPPNVTGVLTMGHVLNNTIQDILCRKARMEGQGSSLAARHRSRGHRHAKRGREGAEESRRNQASR
ncbi:MAG: class I tRNA ligase family protein [Limisphaerales bacterium]